MGRIRASALLALLSFSLVAVGEAAAQPNPATEDERECWRIASAQAEAWNRGDAAALAADFASDGVLIASDGRVVPGRDEIAKHMAELFCTIPKDRHLWIKPQSMRDLGPAGMVVDTDHEVSTAGRPEECGHNSVRRVERRLRVRYIFVRENDRWWIAGQQESEVKAVLVPDGRGDEPAQAVRDDPGSDRSAAP